MIKVLLNVHPEDMGILEIIGQKGLASNGHRQGFQYCLTKAIEEFIEKYKEKKK